MIKRRPIERQSDGNDKSKLPRTGDGYAARGRKPRPDQLKIRSAEEGAHSHSDNRYRGRQPKGWGLARIFPFGRKNKP
jgi:hypothetical protein